MGGVIARLSKPIRSFNIEHRAQKVINKKPIVAPPYESAEKLKKAADESKITLFIIIKLLLNIKHLKDVFYCCS